MVPAATADARDATTRMVIHADDVGMCHGANLAFVELSHRGSISAGSVMVPCPWFAELAEIAASDTRLDVGVHLTLTAEHRDYRWGPVSRPPRSAGLTDELGFLWSSVAQVRRHAHPDAVEAEWRAQIDRALAAGIDVTHLDTHMGSALAPQWCARYLALGVDYGLPALITTTLSAYDPHGHLEDVTDSDFESFVDIARSAAMPVFGRVLETDFDRRRGTPVDYREQLGSTHERLVYCAFHPCRPSRGEIEKIEPDAHHVRVDEYELFRTDAWRSWLAAQAIEIIGMRELRDEWRRDRTSPTPPATG